MSYTIPFMWVSRTSKPNLQQNISGKWLLSGEEELTEEGQRKTWGDGNVLYADRVAGYVTVHISQDSLNCTI